MMLPDYVDLSEIGLSLGKLGRLQSGDELIAKLQSDALPEDREVLDEFLGDPNPLVPCPVIWVVMLAEAQSQADPEWRTVCKRLDASVAYGFTGADLLWQLYQATYEVMQDATRDYVQSLARYGSSAATHYEQVYGPPPSNVGDDPVYYLRCAS